MLSYPKRGALAGQESSVVPLLAGLGVLSYPRTPATSAAADVVVCTAGTWSSAVRFKACDDFRITIDGPAADDLKISATVEFNG